jgi:hypothetical protein
MFVCPGLVSDWFISVLLYYISHWVPGPTETEISGVEPDLSGLH